PTRCGFIAFLPQWDFLNFLTERAARYPTFQLRMRAEVTGLIEESGHVVGVEVDTPEGRLEVRATLVVAADGRHSVVRRQAGLRAFRADAARLAGLPRDRANDIRSWDDVKLLTVLVDRLPTWYRPGLLCIGDAAHAMSPVGGVGINLAIQDAVAAANILAAPLRDGSLSLEHLQQVQQR